jgi:hypothetical protein
MATTQVYFLPSKLYVDHLQLRHIYRQPLLYAIFEDKCFKLCELSTNVKKNLSSPNFNRETRQLMFIFGVLQFMFVFPNMAARL